jgi:hypothetical protein
MQLFLVHRKDATAIRLNKKHSRTKQFASSREGGREEAESRHNTNLAVQAFVRAKHHPFAGQLLFFGSLVILLFAELQLLVAVLTLDEAIRTVGLVRRQILAENRKLAISTRRHFILTLLQRKTNDRLIRQYRGKEQIAGNEGADRLKVGFDSLKFATRQHLHFATSLKVRTLHLRACKHQKTKWNVWVRERTEKLQTSDLQLDVSIRVLFGHDLSIERTNSLLQRSYTGGTETMTTTKT